VSSFESEFTFGGGEGSIFLYDQNDREGGDERAGRGGGGMEEGNERARVFLPSSFGTSLPFDPFHLHSQKFTKRYLKVWTDHLFPLDYLRVGLQPEQPR